ncbi:hypothetical protein ACFQ61_33280 [Streptomyces sp. NPDC056500]|uniref:hypothetical protein n=1 Tax=Streptomyces sp. NPDC056500 TaxID=3345840 RepID=UPI00367DB4FC
MGRGGTAAGVRTTGAGIACGLILALGQAPLPAAAANPDWLSSYETAPDAQPVKGASSASAGGPRLTPGTYVDTISSGERKFYRVALDGTSNAYVSAVLAPPRDGTVSATDGIRVSLRSAEGAQCSVSNDITFGGTTPLPVADYSTRRIGKGRECQTAGDYVYSVEWIGSSGASTASRWPVELKYMKEPGLKAGAVMPSAPASWNTRLPQRVKGEAKGASGGSGFYDATPVGHGVWRDRLNPGESRFYRVPIDWGQQLFVDGDFGDAASDASSVAAGLRMTVFNTARGFVDDTGGDYRGTPTTLSMSTAPAAFANRISDQDDRSAMRFSGWYYLRISLDQRISGPLPVTLRVGISGEPQDGPEYEGDATDAGFGISELERAAAQQNAFLDDDDDRAEMLLIIGVVGLVMGTLLVLWLVVWAVLSRRGRRRRTVARTPFKPSAH